MRIIATLFSLIFITTAVLSGLALARSTKISNIFNTLTGPRTSETDQQINLQRASNANHYVLETTPESASPHYHQIEPALNSVSGPGQPVFDTHHHKNYTDTVKTVTVKTTSQTGSLIDVLIRRIFHGNQQHPQPLTQAPNLLPQQTN